MDMEKNPDSIVDYLDKHFKEKERLKKERKMMGIDGRQELEDKIRQMDERASLDMQKVKVTEFKQKKKQAMENTYM